MGDQKTLGPNPHRQGASVPRAPSGWPGVVRGALGQTRPTQSGCRPSHCLGSNNAALCRAAAMRGQRFSHQIAPLSTAAKLTHARYGSISHPASGRTRQKATSVIANTAHNAKISASARPVR